MSSVDLLIVGGGPAGLAAAIAAREKGFSVLVADSDLPPIDKPCGEGLMPEAIEALRALGVRVPAADSFNFRGIRFHGPGQRIEAEFPNGHGVGIRRTALHRLLLDRASESGASFVWKSRVTGLDAHRAYFGSRTVEARWIVGADGNESTIRRRAGLDRAFLESRRFGFRRHYRIAPWTDCAELYWGDGFQIYVTPVAPEEVCIVAISHDHQLRLDRALEAFPELRAHLRHAIPSSAERGSVTLSRALWRVARGHIALLGDASGSVDAISGEGLCLAFRQARELASALEAGELSRYQTAHRRLMSKPMLSTLFLLSLSRRRWLRERVFRTLAADPARFARLLAMHAGPISIPDFIRRGMVPFTIEILRGSNG